MAWVSIGVLTPRIDTWQFFPQDVFPTPGTFRANFTGDFDRINTFAWVRLFLGVDEVLPAIRLYPKPEKLVFPLSIPQPLIDRGVGVATVGIRKSPSYSSKYPIPETNWVIELEELQ